MSKAAWSPIKEILFTYLAINKIMYWFNTIIVMNQSDLENVGQIVLFRLLSQDLIIIIGVVAFFFLLKLIEMKKKINNSIWGYVIFYSIGYVGLLGIGFVYILIISSIFSQQFLLDVFVREFISFLPTYTLAYLVIAIVLEIKHYFKTKEKKASANAIPAAKSMDDKLAMLKILFDSEILTQEEFECKKEKLIFSKSS